MQRRRAPVVLRVGVRSGLDQGPDNLRAIGVPDHVRDGVAVGLESALSEVIRAICCSGSASQRNPR